MARCLLLNKTQHAVTYCILTRPCWPPALLACVLGLVVAFLSAEFLSSVAIVVGRMGASTALGKAAEAGR